MLTCYQLLSGLYGEQEYWSGVELPQGAENLAFEYFESQTNYENNPPPRQPLASLFDARSFEPRFEYLSPTSHSTTPTPPQQFQRTQSNHSFSDAGQIPEPYPPPQTNGQHIPPTHAKPTYIVEEGEGNKDYREELLQLIEKLNSQSQQLKESRSTQLLEQSRLARQMFYRDSARRGKTDQHQQSLSEEPGSTSSYIQRKLFSMASGIEKEDRHLSFVSPHIELVSAYKEYMWLYFPVHPAALDESNLRYFLSTREGSEDISALSLNISLAICMGKYFTFPLNCY